MWPKVLGHEQNKKVLSQFLQGEKSTPALLFYGPAGVGKRYLAQQFAQSFLCQGNPYSEDSCTSCKAFRAGTHPDLIQVSQLAPGRELLIEQIKDMSRQASYAPTLSKHKVCIIDGADFMKAPAANSLLKLLEEPPDFWLFILIATDINRLLPTILSRVISRRFDGLASEDVAAILQEKQVENPGILANLAAGSPGKALELSEVDALLWRERALYILEHSREVRVMQFMGELPWLEKMPMSEGMVFLEMLLLLLRDALFSKEHITEKLFNPDLVARIGICFASWQSKDIESLIKIVGESYRGIAAKTGSKAVLEALILSINELRKED